MCRLHKNVFIMQGWVQSLDGANLIECVFGCLCSPENYLNFIYNENDTVFIYENYWGTLILLPW